MSEGSDGKTQLGRILLQRKRVLSGQGPDELDELGQLASELSQEALGSPRTAMDMPVELTYALLEEQGEKVIDLRRLSLRLSVLSFVSRDAARDKLLLPLYADAERLFVAVADLHERRLIEELEFTSGRHVHAFLATRGSLRDVIEAAYDAEAAGESAYRGLLTGSLDAAPAAHAPKVELKPVAKVPSELAQLDAGDSVLPPAGGPGGQKGRILVVDDSDDIRRLLARVFREREYEVIESATGLDALQKVRECAPDLLVLDAMLPDVHGFDVCRRIKGSRRYGHIPVVMLSAVYRGWRFAEDLRRSYGVDAFMEKPFRIGEVVAAVERALSGGGPPSQPPEEAEVSGPAGEQLKAGIDAYARGEVVQAIDHLKRGISIDPLAFRLHYHLGLLYGKQENVFEAITELETAADLKPRDFSTLKNLAVLYQRAGFRLKAAELWQRALGSAPDDATRSSIRNHLVSLL
ncbi:MAG: Phosphate regulon transcriptional regulatory protein PhoB [Myxococcaceae bacterium]|nr:Phosphate regulon transcriptional regulatory protein PhoB [Myxococcaceae bacterium]